MRRRGDENGILFVGEDGKWIFVNRGRIDGQRQEADRRAAAGQDAVQLYDTSERPHGQLPRRRRKGDPQAGICPAEVGHRSVTVCHIGAIALRTGKKLKWDPVKEEFDDAEANKMLQPEMRAPWKLEV